MSRGPETNTTTGTTGFRPSARRRNRIAAGLALGAAAIGGNLLVYSSLNDTTSAIQAIENIPAGTQVTASMFRTVDVDVDSSVPTVNGDQLAGLVGHYAKVRIVSGQLVVDLAFQPDPLVETGRAIVAIEVDADLMPTDVRERSNLELVVPGADGTPLSLPGTATEVPTESVSGSASVSLSVEVDAEDAPLVAVAEVVSVVLLPPAPEDVEE